MEPDLDTPGGVLNQKRKSWLIGTTSGIDDQIDHMNKAHYELETEPRYASRGGALLNSNSAARRFQTSQTRDTGVGMVQLRHFDFERMGDAMGDNDYANDAIE